MEKVIGLQIAGCAEVGFDSLLSINWPGKKLDDFMPREDNYTSPVVYFAHIDSEYQTYEAVICRFEGIDLRHSALQVAIRIPVGYGIADEKGNDVSPSAVLRPVLHKIIDENLKSFEGTYEYRGRQVPVFSAEVYAAMISSLRLQSKWGPMVDMGGSRTIYINGANDEDIDRKILAIPYVHRLSQASKVEIGEFSPAVTTIALSDDEIMAKADISVHICTKSGSVESRTLGVVPMNLKSPDFGYNSEIYKEIPIKLTREDVLGAFRHDSFTGEGEGYKVQLLPSKGVVSVVFDPPLRRKGYSIVLKGSGLTDYENEIYDQLQYNRTRVNNRLLGFEGEQIRKFENMSNEMLRDCFFLPPHSRFKIENVRREGDKILITIKKKEEPKERPGQSSKPLPKSEGKAAENGDGRKTMLIKFGPKVKLPKELSLEIRQSEERVVYRTTMPVDKVTTTEEGGEIVAQFVLCRPEAAVDVRVCRPTLYKGRAQLCNDGEYDYEVNMVSRKGAMSRFFSIFSWRYADGLWPVWRDLTVAGVALLLCLLCYFAGVFTSGFGMLADVRDAFAGDHEPVVTTLTPPPANTTVTTDTPEMKDIKPDTVGVTKDVYEADTIGKAKVDSVKNLNPKTKQV